LCFFFFFDRKLVIDAQNLINSEYNVKKFASLILENKNTLEYLIPTENDLYCGWFQSQPVYEALLQCKLLEEFVIEGKRKLEETDLSIQWRNKVALAIAKSCPSVWSLKIMGYLPGDVICEILKDFAFRPVWNSVAGTNNPNSSPPFCFWRQAPGFGFVLVCVFLICFVVGFVVGFVLFLILFLCGYFCLFFLIFLFLVLPGHNRIGRIEARSG
jgi:hypothetical protein